jgi:hypothetical protein
LRRPFGEALLVEYAQRCLGRSALRSDPLAQYRGAIRALRREPRRTEHVCSASLRAVSSASPSATPDCASCSMNQKT